jgi:hypothetical protein
MTIKDIQNAKAQIWANESHDCTIIFDGTNEAIRSEGKYYAECDLTGERKRLTASNFERVLNDMFYDYCVEKAIWI